MVKASSPRDFDIVLFGATGFTGELTARHLAGRIPEAGRWALVGRDQAKLEAVRTRLAEDVPQLADLPILLADSRDEASLRAVAEVTGVVISTVGPYLRYGEGLVKACAESGTDYVDLTGEPEFVDQMYVKYHAAAEASGARLVHSCGFDSIPHDLGALFTVRQLPDDVPLTVRGVVRSNATFSGGTFHSAMEQMPRARQMRAATVARRRVEPKPQGRRSRTVAGKPRRDSRLGYWLLPLPTIDPMVVARSGAALAEYGPDFTYSHYAGTKTLRFAIGGAVGVSALAVGAQVKPLREALKKRVPVGEGPSLSRRDQSWFTVDFIGEGGGTSVHTRVSGGDPGYSETAKMLAESALALAFDDNPETAGQVTTAAAMGDSLLRRVQEVGLRFEVVEPVR